MRALYKILRREEGGGGGRLTSYMHVANTCTHTRCGSN